MPLTWGCQLGTCITMTLKTADSTHLQGVQSRPGASMTQACLPCFSYHLKNEQMVPNTYDKFQGLHPDEALCTWLQNET